jgi:hypothetical protein
MEKCCHSSAAVNDRYLHNRGSTYTAPFQPDLHKRTLFFGLHFVKPNEDGNLYWGFERTGFVTHVFTSP